jgi:hypothetical protein
VTRSLHLLLAAPVVALALVAACSDRVDVTGVVVDRMGGGPLGGVRIEAQPVGGPGGEPAVQAVTDSDGEFSLDGLSRAATYRVTASGLGYADASVDALTPSDSPVRIETFRAAGVRGQVVDAFTDAPVPGARVIAVPRADPEGKARTRVVIADADGRFAIFETRPGLTWELEATADHHTTAGVVAQMPDLGGTLDLEPLVINERPKVVAWVVHALTLEAMGGCQVRWGAVRTTTDETGKFSLADMPNGLQRVELTCGTEAVEASIRVPTRVREHFVRDRIEVLGVPDSGSGLWKIDGQKLVPLQTVLPLPPDLDVEIPAGTVTAGLTTSSHGTKLPQARVEPGVAERALAHATPVYGTETVVWRLPAGAPEALGELRGAPLTRLAAATYDSVAVEGGYYVGVVAIEYLPAHLYVGSAGRRLIRKASRPLVATRRMRIGEGEYGLARLDWDHGAYCVGRVHDDRWTAASGCGLLLLAGQAR